MCNNVAQAATPVSSLALEILQRFLPLTVRGPLNLKFYNNLQNIDSLPTENQSSDFFFVDQAGSDDIAMLTLVLRD